MRFLSAFGAAGLMLGALMGCITTSPSQPHLSVRHLPARESDPVLVSVEFRGLQARDLEKARQVADEDWPARLALYVGADILATNQTPILGSYHVHSDRVAFQPRYPLQPGLSYRAVALPGLLRTDAPPDQQMLVARFTVPARNRTPKTTVAHVYPSADVLPENLLKFYLHFSGPMSRGGIYEHIKLLRGNGAPVDLPFLEIGEELWDRDLTRLTLLIDPGRIKREINPIENLGPALQEGEKYTLVIDRAWADADGVPLRWNHRKEFQVGPPDRLPPDPQQWRIVAPKKNSRAPLVVQFPESMDHALASRLIHVRPRDGVFVAGQVTLSDRERRWAFVPDQSWRNTDYEILTEQILEDLAGNSLGRPFEVDVAQPLNPAPPAKLPFHPR